MESKGIIGDIQAILYCNLHIFRQNIVISLYLDEGFEAGKDVGKYKIEFCRQLRSHVAVFLFTLYTAG